MQRGPQGTYRLHKSGGETVRCFVPHPLPPRPSLELDVSLYDQLEVANRALGRLDGIATLLPDRLLFLYFYVRKEALLSSQIEGTQSSLSDLLLHESGEAPGVPLDDVQEVSCYVRALEYGLERLRSGFPLSVRLIREIHHVLLSSGRGSEKTPGEFRTSQNWIGGSRPGNALYVPPPADEVLTCMGQLEHFLHDTEGRTPVLIKSALAHVQFETIHPFLDGNGRLGRLLITFILCAEGALSEPLLYLSLYLKTHRSRYYELLQQTRVEGDWEAWLRFFLEGVTVTADQAGTTARRILDLFERDRKVIETLGRTANSTLRVHSALCRHVLATVPQLTAELGLSAPTVATALRVMLEKGIVTEATGRQRGRVFVYRNYLDFLSEGTEPLPASP